MQDTSEILNSETAIKNIINAIMSNKRAYTLTIIQNLNLATIELAISQKSIKRSVGDLHRLALAALENEFIALARSSGEREHILTAAAENLRLEAIVNARDRVRHQRRINSRSIKAPKDALMLFKNDTLISDC